MKRLLVVVALLLAALQLSAQEQHKNVQLLKDLTPAQFDQAMNLMRSSLGVGCDFCHVLKDKELDFASDEKSEKKRAREMIQLVFDTNDEVLQQAAHRDVQHLSPRVDEPGRPRFSAAGDPAVPDAGTQTTSPADRATKWSRSTRRRLGKIDKNALASIDHEGHARGSRTGRNRS